MITFLFRFFTEALGMKVLRKREVPEEKYSYAFLGFGPEQSHFVVQLIYSKILLLLLLLPLLACTKIQFLPTKKMYTKKSICFYGFMERCSWVIVNSLYICIEIICRALLDTAYIKHITGNMIFITGNIRCYMLNISCPVKPNNRWFF